MRIGWESSWGASQSCIPNANLDDYIFGANLENYIPDANPENYFLTQISIFILKWYFFSRIFYPKTTFAPYENLDKCISDANLDNCVPNTSLDSYISDANLENYIIMSQT